jgi:hypothetical protein
VALVRPAEISARNSAKDFGFSTKVSAVFVSLANRNPSSTF